MIKIMIAFTLAGILVSCGGKRSEGIYDEGKIEYKITYLNADKDHYDPSFLPKKMTLTFNQEFCINQIDGFMGFFKLGNISYFKRKRIRTHLKVLDKNYSYRGGRNDMMCCFDDMNGMTISEDTVSCKIAGLKSKKAIVRFKDSKDTFSIYYTDEIKLAHPNETNPYNQVEGVLTAFRLTMGPYLMQFYATKFDPGFKVEKEMDVPKGSIEVNRDELVTILARLMEQNR
jgi:hypothetical protein